MNALFISWIHSIYLNKAVFFWPHTDNVLMTIFMTPFFSKTLLLTSIKWNRKCSSTYCLPTFSFTTGRIFDSKVLHKKWSFPLRISSEIWDEIRRFLQIWSHEETLNEKLCIFVKVCLTDILWRHLEDRQNIFGHFNLFQPNIAFHIETSHLFAFVLQGKRHCHDLVLGSFI